MTYDDRPVDRNSDDLTSPPAPRVDPWSEQYLDGRTAADNRSAPPVPTAPPEPAAPPEPSYPAAPEAVEPDTYEPPMYEPADEDPDTEPAPSHTMPTPKPAQEWPEYRHAAPLPKIAPPPETLPQPVQPPRAAQPTQAAQAPQAAPTPQRPAVPPTAARQAAPPTTPAPVRPTAAQEFAAPPTAADFAARRTHAPEQPPATMGLQGLLRKASLGYFAPAPSLRELSHRQSVATVRRNFGGLRQITVVNPKGGAGKTVAVLMTAMTFGQQRGGYVLSWDNNETQGTLGMRAQQDFHHRTVRDLLAELDTFAGEAGRVGDLSRYVRSQGEAMFDVLASDESATAGEMLTASAFRNLREVVSRFYKLIIVDTGNNVRAENWQAAIEATDQLVVPMSARGDSAETAARMLDHLDQTGRHELVRRAVSVISMPASTKGTDLAAIRNHFAARTRTVLTAPYEPLLDSGEPIRYELISNKSREAWLTIAAAIAEGL
jgi:MinD-like ATPase involved in chromosome partitioning or flagellar assembly